MSPLPTDRPEGLLPLRAWLLAWRQKLVQEPVPTSQYAQDIVSIDYELAELDEKLRRAAFGIVSKLPTCEECGKTALYVLRHGPYLCEACAQEHPTAQKVAWYDEARLLGLDRGA